MEFLSKRIHDLRKSSDDSVHSKMDNNQRRHTYESAANKPLTLNQMFRSRVSSFGRPAKKVLRSKSVGYNNYYSSCQRHNVREAEESSHIRENSNGNVSSTAATAEDQFCFNVEKQILKAKAEARTVSFIDGDLYIDYQYICPIPGGLKL